VGGGVITVPALLVVFRVLGIESDFAAKGAVATSLAAMVPNAISSARQHYLAGKVIWRDVLWMIPGGTLAAMAGSTLAVHVSGDLLKRLFGALEIAVALSMLLMKGRTEGNFNDGRGSPVVLFLTGIAAGLTSAFFGIGGGVVGVPLMMYACGYSPHAAIGNSSALIVFNALVGVSGYIWHGVGIHEGGSYFVGYVNWLVWILIAASGIISARAGAMRTARSNPEKLKKYFALLLFLIGLRLLFG
jgi:uncharacterized membrane protein YfcA